VSEERGKERAFLAHRIYSNRTSIRYMKKKELNCYDNGTQNTDDSKAAWDGVPITEPSATRSTAEPGELCGSDSKAAFNGVAMSNRIIPLLLSADLRIVIFVWFELFNRFVIFV
jgi:hypothetical protein